MMKINWVKKLTSRKFWVSICSFITEIMVALNCPENKIAQIVAIVMAGATVIAYTIAEGLVDNSNAKKSDSITDNIESDESTDTTKTDAADET